jgi:hypothetical protein
VASTVIGATKASTWSLAVVERVDAEAAAAAVDLGPAQEVDDGVVLVEGDVGVGVGCGEEGALDLSAGHVAVVDDAAVRVAAFAAELEGTRFVGADGVEADAVGVDEAAHEGGAVLDGVLHHVAVAEASADDEGVLDVLARESSPAKTAEIPPWAQRCCWIGAVLGEDRDGAALGDLEGEVEAGEAAAEHEVAGVMGGR